MIAGRGFTQLRPSAVLTGTSLAKNAGQKVCLARSLRPRLRATAREVSVAGISRSLPALRNDFFDRKDEIAALNVEFDGQPKGVLFLLGPSNSGKTKLLKEVRDRRNLAHATQRDGPPPILHLDCRGKIITSPQQFASVIRELVTNDNPFKAWWETSVKNVRAASTVKGPGIDLNLEEIFMPVPDKAPMASIIDSLTTFLAAVRHLPQKPVIIIDEAIVLMDWSDDPGHEQLRDLLSFLVRVTKHERLAHIVLSSSDYFLVEWLENEGLKGEDYTVQVIGHLPNNDEAKGFVESRMRCGAAPPSFFDKTEDGKEINMWPQVYAVCGGNIGLLKRCASYVKAFGSWKDGLEWISNNHEGGVRKGLRPGLFSSKYGGSRSPAAWTKEDYKTVVREIALAKEHMHAVSFNACNKRAVLSLVEWNRLDLRVKSEWAKDLPVSVFNDLKDTRLVTMPTSIDLYFVLKMYEDGKLD